MCSTSELIFRTLWQLDAFEQMTRRCAISIYCGMMTDTCGFTYNSSRPEIYFIIGQLLTKGFDKDKIYRNVFNNYSSWAIRLRGYIMYQKLNVFEDLHAAFFTITRQDMKNFHFIKGDAEGLVNEPLKIKGMKLSISLREDDRRDNLVWVSLRSVDSFPCNKMAEQFFNGGGHLNASGGRLQCSVEEAVQKVREAIIQFNGQLKS
jgi:phosphoesterase RecJ-like protein